MAFIGKWPWYKQHNSIQVVCSTIVKNNVEAKKTVEGEEPEGLMVLSSDVFGK